MFDLQLLIWVILKFSSTSQCLNRSNCANMKCSCANACSGCDLAPSASAPVGVLSLICRCMVGPHAHARSHSHQPSGPAHSGRSRWPRRGAPRPTCPTASPSHLAFTLGQTEPLPAPSSAPLAAIAPYQACSSATFH
jgi:hypothetical protein